MTSICTAPLPPLLLSYALLNPSLTAFIRHVMATHTCTLMIDSGAFTAYKLDKKIDLNAYAEFLKSLPPSPRLWGAVTLDVVGDRDATMRNTEWLVSRGFSVMPVFTVNASYDDVKTLRSFGKRICIPGGTAKFTGATQWVKDRVSRVHRMLDGDVEIHALGFARWPDVLRIPITTCDATTIDNAARFGCVKSFDPTRGMRYCRITDTGHPNFVAMANLLRLTPDDLRDQRALSRGARCAIGCGAIAAHWKQVEWAKRFGRIMFQAISLDLIVGFVGLRLCESFAEWRRYCSDLMAIPAGEPRGVAVAKEWARAESA